MICHAILRSLLASGSHALAQGEVADRYALFYPGTGALLNPALGLGAPDRDVFADVEYAGVCHSRI